MPQSPSTSLTIRTHIAAEIGNFGRVMAAIGAAGAEVGGVDIVRSTKSSVTRDITVYIRDTAHGEEVVDALNALDGVEVQGTSDRVMLSHHGGKMTMQNRAALETRDDLSMAYTPGVARVCMAIHHDPERTWDLTIRGNSVAVITDGSSVVGQGDLGPLAALPSAEAKCMFLREMAGIDGFPLPLTVRDTDQIANVVSKIVSVFAGVHLTDMAAPRCFEVQQTLGGMIDIPVLHDNQEGTSAALLAGLINALGLAGKDLANATVVIAGLGPSGVATARLLVAAGVGQILTCNSDGAVHAGKAYPEPELAWVAEHTNPDRREGDARTLLEGADALIGLSTPNLIDAATVKTMASDPIVFALAMPSPELPLSEAGAAAVYATGRPDLPNQINSSLAFPGIWRGALDCRATRIDDGMVMAAARAIAETSAGAVAPDHVVPSVFNVDLVPNVARAVRAAAEASGLARLTAASA
jgi:malate dehydrogenase (oxaloacetate-decarboxylating)